MVPQLFSDYSPFTIHSRQRVGASLKIFPPLIQQERPIDLRRIGIDVVACDALGFEMLFPTLYDTRDGTHFPFCSLGIESEELRHRQGIVDRRVGLRLADAHLLKAERLN